MTETITAPQAPDLGDTRDPYQGAPQRDADRARWARYWQEMRQHCIRLTEEAFDDVTRRFATGETWAAVEIVQFAAVEDVDAKGIVRALHELLMNGLTAHSIARDYEDGVPMEELLGWVR